MEQSLFIEWINKYFPALTLKIVETINDTKNPVTYLHLRMLKKDYSVSGKWESISAAYSLVMADVVAMDSSLPLKRRDAISKAAGDIPKMGMELKLNEKQLTDLDTLIAQGGNVNQILAKLFADTPKVIAGIYERNEAIFLEGLSTGVALIEDNENVGTGNRIDYGYLPSNKFGVSVLWDNASTAKPYDDIQRLLNKASSDGNTITRILMDRATFNYMSATTQTKELFAFNSNFVGSNIPAPSLTQMNTFTNDRFGFTIEIVDRSVRYEINGVQTAVKPWAVGAVVAITNEQVGTRTWARLAEQNHPVANVVYSTVDDFILVSKYRLVRPSLSEHTTSQARVIPVISNVDQIYTIDTLTVQA